MTGDPPPLAPDQIFAALERHNVRYVLVGGVAAQAYGAERATLDLDICPSWDTANFHALADALRDLDARFKHTGPEFRLPADDRLIAGMEISAWRTQAGDIDVLLGIPRQRQPRRRANYDQLVASASTIHIGEHRIPVASLDDLIRSKEAAGRPKDHEALPELRRLAAGQ